MKVAYCRYDGVRYGHRADATSLKSMYMDSRGQCLGEEVKRRILMGTYALSAGYYDAFYTKAQQVLSSPSDSKGPMNCRHCFFVYVTVHIILYASGSAGIVCSASAVIMWCQHAAIAACQHLYSES